MKRRVGVRDYLCVHARVIVMIVIQRDRSLVMNVILRHMVEKITLPLNSG